MTAASLLGILAFCVGVPAVTGALFAFPQFRRLFLAIMVFTTCYVKKPLYQEVFFVNYRGVDRGFGVTLPDLFFFGFLLWMMAGGLKAKVRWLPFNSIPWFLLIVISSLSLVGSLEPLYGMFTIHKFIRCWVFYLVMVNLVRTREDVLTVLTALGAAVIFEGVVVLWSKYVTKAVVARSIGTFRHPNTLAMYTDLVLPVLVGALLTGLAGKNRQSLYTAAILMGFIAVLFTKSRAAMLLLPMSLGIVVAASILMKPTGRKFMVLAGGLIAVLVITAVALPRLIRRFESAPKESAETREYFNEAAHAMARDRLFGVGLNQYSHALAMADYYWLVYPDKTEVEDPEGFRESVQGQSRLGTAHHIYWLYAAETGYLGLVAFLLHTGLFSLYNLYLFLREKDHLFKSIFLGLLVGTSIHHLHGVLEWIFRQTEVQYLYFALMGTMVAMPSVKVREAAAERAKALSNKQSVPIVPVAQVKQCQPMDKEQRVRMTESERPDEEGSGGGRGLPVDLRAIGLGLWRLRWFFGGSLAVAVVLGLGAGKALVTRAYTAETLMLYQAPPLETPEGASTPSLLTLMNMVKLPSNLNAVGQKLDLNVDARTLGGATVVELQPKTTLVAVRATWESPRVAADIANSLRETFLDSQSRLRREEAESRVRETETRMGAVNGELKKAEEALRTFTAENRVVDLTEEARALLEEQTTGNLLYEQALIEKNSIQTQAENADKIIKQLQSDMAEEQQAQAAVSDAMSETNIRIQRLRESIMDDKEKRSNDALLEEARLQMQSASRLYEEGAGSKADFDTAKARYESLQAKTIDTPQITGWKGEIETLDKKVIPSTGGAGGLTGNLLKDVMFRSFELRLQATTVEQRVTSLKQAKDRVEARLQRLPDLQRTFAQLTRDVTTLETEKAYLEAKLSEGRRLVNASSLPFMLVSEAQPPIRSSSSNAKKIAVGVAFLLVATSWFVLLAIVILDPRIRTRRELEIALGETPVVGELPEGQPENDPLDDDAPRAEVFREAARQIRVLYPEQGLRVLVTAPGYGEGTTSVTLNLAAVLARWGENVLIVDAHFTGENRKGATEAPEPLGQDVPSWKSRLERTVGIARRMGVQRSPTGGVSLTAIQEGSNSKGLVDLIEDERLGILDVARPTTLPGVSLIGRSDRAGSKDLVGSERLRRCLEEASRHYSIILIDGPPILTSSEALTAASGAHGIFLVVRAMGPFGLIVRQVRVRMEQMGVKPLAGLINRTTPPYATQSAPIED